MTKLKKKISNVEFVKNPKDKKYGDKYKLSVKMDKRDQFVLAYALLANKLRSKPEIKELQDYAHFYETQTEKKKVEVKGKTQTKTVNKTVKVNMRRDKWKLEFASQDTLHKLALETYPELMSEVVEEHVYIPKQIESLKNRIQARGKNKVERLLLTCAVGDAPVHWGMVSAMKNYMATVGNSMGIVYSADNIFSAIHNFFHQDDDFFVLFDDLKVNSNLYLNNIKMRPTQKNPLTGLDTFCMQYDSSVIVGAPKQGWEPVGGVEGTVKYKACTGAITKPNYTSKKYGQYRTDKIAENEHELGFILIELDKNDIFHMRTIEVNSDGSFIDQGILFKPCVDVKKDEHGDDYVDMNTLPKKVSDRIKLVPVSNSSLGDLHAEHVDPVIEKLTIQQIDTLKSETITLHDSIDFNTISHHIDADTTEKQALDLIGKKDVAHELTTTAEVINRIIDRPSVKRVFEAFSNHDDFLARCLASGRHLHDDRNGFVQSVLYPSAVLYKAKQYKECESATNANPSKIKPFTRKDALETINKRFGKTFANWMEKYQGWLLDCKHPALLALEMFGLKTDQEGKEVKFLGADEFYKVKGIYINFHGNFRFKGLNALKNTMKAVMGHTHKGMKVPGHKLYYSGVMKTKAKYAMGGLPNWTATHTHIYPTGQVQQINMVAGKWRKEDGVYDKLRKIAA